MDKIICGDCLVELKRLPDNSVDSLVTDPPAGIAFMGKEWDNFGKANKSIGGKSPANEQSSVGYFKQRGARQSSNGRDQFIAFMTEVMTECYRVMKPGSHGLVWALPRTSHWTGTALEDAGFEVRDKIYHAFGQGFPKSANISLAFDKLNGNIGNRGKAFRTAGAGDREDIQGKNGKSGMAYNDPSSPLAKQWDGFGSALKPAVEEWFLIRKPLDGTIAGNVAKWGTGGLNIDGCRIGDEIIKHSQDHVSFQRWKEADGRAHKEVTNPEPTYNQGRYPSHLILDDSDEVTECFPVTNGNCKRVIGGTPRKTDGFVCSGSPDRSNAIMSFGDSGSASRYFKRLAYFPKASKRDRDEGLDDYELQAAGGMQGRHDGKFDGKITYSRNVHPTVKSTELMRYLCKLITPPNGLILDPFGGSGSTGKAAVLEGFHYCLIEQNPDYVAIAERRVLSARQQLTLELK